MSAAYRTAENLDPEPPYPEGCPCGCSLATRTAYGALGGWWHTEECDRWRAWAKRNGVKDDRSWARNKRGEFFEYEREFIRDMGD
jgi:hypothetical protein